MKEKNSKRVVIIDDIDSCSIEQAIFILRNSGTVEKPDKRTIVGEAERIINAYVQTIERTQRGIGKKEKKSRRTKPEGRGRRDVGVWIAVVCFALALGLIFYSVGFPAGA